MIDAPLMISSLKLTSVILMPHEGILKVPEGISEMTENVVLRSPKKWTERRRTINQSCSKYFWRSASQPTNRPRPLGPNCRVDFSATNEAVNYKFTTVHFGHRLSLKIWSLNCVYWIDISWMEQLTTWANMRILPLKCSTDKGYSQDFDDFLLA